MNSDRWRQVEDIYHSALDQAPPQRSVFVAKACSGDADLQREVESLLREDSAGDRMLERPVWEVVRDPARRLKPNAQLGPYRIEHSLGAGGMGEVYRATDTRLGRTVAIKVLHGPHSDRFKREARAISALNHPHICTLHDIGEESGTPYLVMEHVDGETLAARLKKGPLPMATVLRYGSEIAGALAAAHASGIVHRDLKPANVMLTSSGVKLLDFGIARIVRPLFGERGAAGTQPATAKGAVMGTAPYMAPEQIEGHECDARTDIFALGLLLYEMAAGRRAFNEDSHARLMAAILKDEPPRLDLKSAPRFEEILRGCLVKNPAERWQSAQDVQKALALVTGEPADLPKRGNLRWLAFTAGAAIISVAVLLAAWRLRPDPSFELGATRFLVTPPAGMDFVSMPAVSPDGKQVAFVAIGVTGQASIWLRRIDQVKLQQLDNTEGAEFPFWSPDGRFLAFFARQRLKKIAVSGGTAQILCELSSPRSAGTWGPDGSIVFTGREGLLRVSASGGAAVPITKLNEADGELTHAWPQLLPDGKHLLYLSRNRDLARSAIYLQRLGSAERKLLLSSRFKALFASPDHLLYLREPGALFRQSVDLRSYQLGGEPALLAEGIPGIPGPLTFSAVGGSAEFAVSDGGAFAYGQGRPQLSSLVWRSRTGEKLGTLGEPDTYSLAALSPDQSRVAVTRRLGNRPFDLWQFELSTGGLSRLTVDTAFSEQGPLWSPDSRSVLVYDAAAGDCEIHEVTTASRSSRVIYSDRTTFCWLGDWSRDGRFVVYHSTIGARHIVSLLPLTGAIKPRVIAEGDYQMDEFHFSPDGKWLAFDSNETGRFEVYVASLPSFSEKRQISIAGGVQPVWRKDGKELLFLNPDGKLMSVAINGSPLATGVPRVLFQTALRAPEYRNTVYQATADGAKFLFTEPAGPPAASPLTVVLNWTAGLKR